MNKLVIVAAAILLLASCSKPATESSSVVGEFQVDRLFTVDGCTVYRFSDAGYSRYFTNCKGSVSSSYNVQSGKSRSTRTEEISTEVQQ